MQARHTFLVLSCALTVCALTAAAQKSGQQQQPSLVLPPVSAEVVYVDVAVTGKDGRPAAGLTRDDFEVLEDGRHVEIVNFSAGLSSAAAPEPGEPTVAVPDAAPVPARPRPRVSDDRRVDVVLYVDEANLHPIGRKRVLERLQSFFVGLPPGDRVMVVTHGDDFRARLPFTEDLAAVREALRALEKDGGRALVADADRRALVRRLETAGPDESQALLFQVRNYAERQSQELRRTLDSFKRFLGLLGGLPGRKALLYVSDGLPGRPGEAMLQAWANRFGEQALLAPDGSLTNNEGTLFSEAENRTGAATFRDVVDQANANRVTLYTIDAATAQASFDVSAEEAGTGALGDRVWDSAVDAQWKNDLSGSLGYLADFTGGRRLPVDSKLPARLRQLAEDLDAAYSLAYVPAHTGEGRFHKISVKVKRPGLGVRHREGYFDKGPEDRAADMAFAALMAAPENPLDLRLETGKPQPDGRGGFHVPLVVKLPVGKLRFVPEGDAQVGKLTVYFVVQSAAGGLSAVQKRAVPLRFPADKLHEGARQVTGFPVPLGLKPGEYTVAVVVRDEIAARRSATSLKIKL